MQKLSNLLRMHDYERYLCGLFAPYSARPHIFSALALAYELLRIPATVSDEMVGLVRLKWWQEKIMQCYHQDLKGEEHPTLRAVTEYVAQGNVPLALYDALCEAVAEQIGRTSDIIKIRHTLATLYRLLAHAAGDAKDAEYYAAIGEMQGNIALIRSVALRDGNMIRVEEIIATLQEITLPDHASRYARTLAGLNHMWIKRIAIAHQRRNVSMLHHMPLLAVRLLLK